MLELEMRRRAIRALLDKEGKDSNKETPTQSTENGSGRTDTESQKVTPVRNFRKKKHSKNDDVIVIVPKVVTIDLTDEKKTNDVENTVVVSSPNNVEVENLINSIEINTDNDKDQLHVNNHSTDNSEESSNTLEAKSDGDAEGNKIVSNVTNEVIDIPDSPEQNKTKDNAEKEQQNQEKPIGGQEEQPTNSWALRWLDSKDVKRVVSTSKICGNIRKKIRSAKLAKKSQENIPIEVRETPEIQGSVGEYQSLPKSSTALNTTTDTTTGNKTEDDNSSQVDKSEKDKTVFDSKEPTLEVEQVQDITSTKNENSILKTTQDEIMSDVHVNETLNSNSDYLLKEKEGDSQGINNPETRPVQVEMSKSNMIVTNNFSCDQLEVDTTLKLNNSSVMLINNQEVNQCIETPKDDKICSDVANNLISETAESDLARPDNMETNITNSDKMETNITNFKGFENLSKNNPFPHDETSDVESNNSKSEKTEHELISNLDLNDETSKSTNILNHDISSCNAKKSSMTESSEKPTEQLSPVEFSSEPQDVGNELEALEIDITEEDRDIE